MKLAVWAALAAGIAASSVSAAPGENPLARDHVAMSLRGLDLATVSGQQALAIRMDQAARAVCGDRLATVHLALEQQSRACQADVKADIRARIEQRVAGESPDTLPRVQVASR